MTIIVLDDDILSEVKSFLEMSFTDKDIPKFFHVAVELSYWDDDSKGAVNKFLRYMKARVIPGVQGISDSGEIKFDWFGMGGRNALLTMPGKELVKLNKITRILYDNPDYLVSNGFAALRRIYSSADIPRALQNINQEIIRTVSRGGAKDIAHILDGYGDILNWSDDLSKGLGKVKNLRQFAKQYRKNLISHWKKRKETSWAKFELDQLIEWLSNLSDAKWVDILGKAVVSAVAPYRNESEWILKNNKLRIPKGSRLYIVDHPYMGGKVEEYTKGKGGLTTKWAMDLIRRKGEKAAWPIAKAAYEAEFGHNPPPGFTDLFSKFGLKNLVNREDFVKRVPKDYKPVFLDAARWEQVRISKQVKLAKKRAKAVA